MGKAFPAKNGKSFRDKMGKAFSVPKWETIFWTKVENHFRVKNEGKYFRDKNGKSIFGTKMGKVFPEQNGKRQLVSVKGNK